MRELPKPNSNLTFCTAQLRRLATNVIIARHATNAIIARYVQLRHRPATLESATSAPTPASRADTRAPAVSNSNLSAERGDGSCVELGAECGGDLPAGAAAFFDAIWLIDEAKRRVFERFGVMLECEVVIL